MQQERTVTLSSYLAMDINLVVGIVMRIKVVFGLELKTIITVAVETIYGYVKEKHTGAVLF